MPSTMTSTSRILTSLFFINTSCFLEPPSKTALFHKALARNLTKKPVQKPTARAIRYRKSPCSVWASTKPANVSDLSAYCGITVTDSRGFSPHSASGALPERCNYSFSFIITMRGSIFKSFPPFFRVKNRMMINHIIKAADSRLSAAYVLWVLSCPSGAERRNARNRPLEKLVVQPENDVPAQDERE